MMMQPSSPTDAEKEAKQREFFEKARKGVLKYLDEKGGRLSLNELHDFSLNEYFIQHQRFSQLLETLVENNLVDYDFSEQVATITEAGRKFALG